MISTVHAALSDAHMIEDIKTERSAQSAESLTLETAHGRKGKVRIVRTL